MLALEAVISLPLPHAAHLDCAKRLTATALSRSDGSRTSNTLPTAAGPTDMGRRIGAGCVLVAAAGWADRATATNHALDGGDGIVTLALNGPPK